MSLDATKLRHLIEAMPFHGGGVEGAMWAVGEIVKELGQPPKLYEGVNVALCNQDRKPLIAFTVDQIATIEQLHYERFSQGKVVNTTIVTLKSNGGVRVDFGMPYDEFKAKYPELF